MCCVGRTVGLGLKTWFQTPVPTYGETLDRLLHASESPHQMIVIGANRRLLSGLVIQLNETMLVKAYRVLPDI